MRKSTVLAAVVIAVFALGAFSGITIRRYVLNLPHIRVVNVANGCHLNGDPFTREWTVRDSADGKLVWQGRSEAEALTMLLNRCE